MAYEYEDDLIGELEHIENEHLLDFSDKINELQEVYRKAKAWNEIHEMLTDKDITELFDNEMYKLLRQTDKSDAKIIKEVIQLFLNKLERADDER